MSSGGVERKWKVKSVGEVVVLPAAWEFAVERFARRSSKKALAPAPTSLPGRNASRCMV
jgi:hypothetical protein